MSVNIIHGDCLDVMRSMPDAAFDCVVTDPPYGIDADSKQRARSDKQHGGAWAKSRDYGTAKWDGERPPREAFDSLRRVGRHAVVWGGNYFADLLGPTPSWIVWDKDNGTNVYADFEVAWTSHARAARKVRWRWHGMLQEPGFPRDERVHPTQKPLGLMLWVIEHYTSRNDLILDPYCGSGTTGVACAMLGRRFVGIDRDEGYVATARQRIADAESQLTMVGVA
jgi:site-specific DNA-methyltransferase (adenine-specific)